MASSKEYLDFVIEQLSGLDEITYKAISGIIRMKRRNDEKDIKG